MELNKLMGVEKTYMYATYADDMMRSVFRYYESSGHLEVFNITGVRPGIFRYANSGMMQECLYRTMYRTKYLTYLDPDENIVPRQNGVFTLSMLIANSECEYRSYIPVLNYFFHPDWPDDTQYANDSLIANKLNLWSMLKTLREPSHLNFENRSRFLLRPEKS